MIHSSPQVGPTCQPAMSCNDQSLDSWQSAFQPYTGCGLQWVTMSSTKFPHSKSPLLLPYFTDHCTPGMYTFTAGGGVQYYVKKIKLLKIRFPIPSKNVLIVHIEKKIENS